MGGSCAHPAKNCVFDLERRGEDEGEDSGHRSILGLEGIAFSGDRKASAAPGAASQPAPVRQPAAPDPALFPDGEEPSDRRSILGLERIELVPEWKACVAANASAQLIASRESAELQEPALSRDQEEDSGHPSILGLERIRFVPRRRAGVAGGAPSDPAAARQAVAPRAPAAPRGSLPQRDLLSLREPFTPTEVDPPQFERDLEPRLVQPIPVERAILFSLALHIVLFLLLRWAPAGGTVDPRRGLLAGLIPEAEKIEDQVPIVFRSAPGPQRPNPNRSDPSDKTRRAGGGDPSRPRSESPFVPERPGVEGLAPGAGRSARAARPRIASGEKGERTAALGGEAAKSSSPDAILQPPLGPSSSGRSGRSLTNLDAAIRDAARAQVEGEGGAGFPNPEGGFVDSDAISFETSWYDWGEYADAMVRRIKLHWKVPMDLMMLGVKGRVTIRFSIMANGQVTGAEILRPSEHPPLTNAAFQAIVTSNPFRPLPKDLLAQVPGKDRERIVVTFFYNIRPGKE
jgi:TonB family protein